MDTQVNHPGPRPWATIAAVTAGPILAGILASAFNIWYNLAHVQPLLDEWQLDRFTQAIALYNAIAYPLAIAVAIWIVMPIYRALKQTQATNKPDAGVLERSQRRAINLPWCFSVLILVCWSGCLPSFLFAVQSSQSPLNPMFASHLTASLAIAALIHITHAFFLTELLTARFVFPTLFQNHKPSDTPGTLPMTLRRRGVMWAVSAVACPIGSLLLLITMDQIDRWFAFSVGAIGIVFGLIGAGLMSRLVARPVQMLKEAADAVAQGSLEVRVDLLRADEFGPLSEAFNHMVEQMRQKETLRQTFGLHVGQQAAKQILETDPGLGGRECDVTILFCDIRQFTKRCDGASAQQIVQLLNIFLAEMVTVVETDHGGLVNKFLGDGFMALFGADSKNDDHAHQAVRAGLRMLEQLQNVNQRLGDAEHAPIEIGVGIHTGIAIVGNIGSEDRLEYTAIGQAVNIASRIESLTKQIGRPLLISDPTRQRLNGQIECDSMGSHTLRGQDEPMGIFAPDSTG